MKLFEAVVENKRLHHNFKTIAVEAREKERQVLQCWADGFPDRDGKFVQEFQVSFNPCFWELYLHAVFKEYGFSFDWSQSSPDFLINKNGISISVEAATAGPANGKPAEWEVPFTPDKMEELKLGKLNREAIIRLSNAFYEKWKKYKASYSKMKNVAGHPFVLAIAPFEQPYFNLQYNRPITALLYDYYVDEEACLNNPEKYPDGPPSRHLGFVEKDNGTEIELGAFTDDGCREISAVIFSCTATWGKVDAMTANPSISRIFHTIWGSPPSGAPVVRSVPASEYTETLFDGLQVYHNPYALNPIDPKVFRRDGVVQVFGDPKTKTLHWEGEESCLMYRLAVNMAVDPNANASEGTCES